MYDIWEVIGVLLCGIGLGACFSQLIIALKTQKRRAG